MSFTKLISQLVFSFDFCIFNRKSNYLCENKFTFPLILGVIKHTTNPMTNLASLMPVNYHGNKTLFLITFLPNCPKSHLFTLLASLSMGSLQLRALLLHITNSTHRACTNPCRHLISSNSFHCHFNIAFPFHLVCCCIVIRELEEESFLSGVTAGIRSQHCTTSSFPLVHVALHPAAMNFMWYLLVWSLW